MTLVCHMILCDDMTEGSSNFRISSLLCGLARQHDPSVM